MRVSGLCVVALIAFSSGRSDANVSLTNGNFNIGYTDIIYAGGLEPKIERVYNSKTPFKGGFGWGWGWEWDAYLVVEGDGTVQVHEYGGGAANVFAAAKHPTRAEIDGEVTAILAAHPTAEAELALYRSRLQDEPSFRADEWEKLLTEKKVKQPDLAQGAELTSERFSHQRVVRTAEGFARIEGARTDLFDVTGHLIRVSDTNGNTLLFERDAQGRIHTMSDNFKRTITLTYTPKNFIASITGKDGKSVRVATYRYNARDELVYSKDTDGNVYLFEYDKHGRHNLTAIRYPDKTSMEIGYYPRTRQESVSVVRDRDGTSTVYAYETSAQDRYAVSMDGLGSDGQPSSSSRYEYVYGHRPDGSEYTSSLTTVFDGDRTDTEYDATCGLPLKIRHAGEVTTFRYDGRCQVTYKETPTDITKLTYDAKVNKVSRVEKQSKLRTDSTSWASYGYDASGNLLTAEDSDGKKLSLTYDEHGRISGITSHGEQPRTMRFVYNEMSKPIEMTVDGIGTIKVQYTPSGEIKKVDSDGGRSVALQVTSVYSELLDVIRPSGITLSL